MRKSIIVSFVVILLVVMVGFYFLFKLSSLSHIDKDVNETYASDIILNSELAECAAIFNAKTKFLENNTEFGESAWFVVADTPIEEINFSIGKNSGKILKATRQVLYPQCLLIKPESEVIEFCCDCINSNPLCNETKEKSIVLKKKNAINQIKTMLGNKINSLPKPWDCESRLTFVDKNFCYNLLAKVRKDYSICSNILNNEFFLRQTCYMDVALYKNEPSGCQEIEILSIRETCNNNFRIK